MGEQVLAVPTAHFDQLGRFEGFKSCDEDYLEELIAPGKAKFIERDLAESDPRFKQIIPYVILRQKLRHGRVGDFVFYYTRSKDGGEVRLYGKKSIGIGGHINVDDGHVGIPLFHSAMMRELAEETDVQPPYRYRMIGCINDDSNDVGKVHLGIVYLFDIQQPEVCAKEASIAFPGFLPEGILKDDLIDEFEVWSQICLRSIDW